MTRKRTKEENLEGLIRSLEVMKMGIDTYKAGYFTGWQPVSVELNKLLVDRQSGPLAKVVFPDFKLHPMITRIPPKNEATEENLLFDPVRKHLEPGRMWVEVFDETKEPIPLTDWLDQVFLVSDGHYITIRDYIKYLRDYDSAHFSQEVGTRQDCLAAWTITIGGQQQSNIEMYTVALGEYVLRQLMARSEVRGL